MACTGRDGGDGAVGASENGAADAALTAYTSRADDADFDPAPGDWLTVGDGDEAPLRDRAICTDTQF